MQIQIHRDKNVSAYHAAQIRLRGIRAISIHVKNPFGTDAFDDSDQTLLIAQISFMQLHIILDCCDAPEMMISVQEQMQLVTVAQEPPGKICADESARTCQDDALHLLNEMLVIEDFKILTS